MSKNILGFAFVFMMFSCTGIEKNNQLSDEEKKEGWTLLFDGTTTNGWHIYNKGNIPSAWTAQNGELTCNFESKSAHGDLVTDDVFENFDLVFDWKIAKGGNSGVFINVQEDTTLRTTWASGPEYQLLENTHRDTADALKRAGSLFGLLPSQNPVTVKPAGEWNQSRITQTNGKVQFYLNGVLTVEEDLLSKDWHDRVAQHPMFKTLPEFGNHTKGHIALQEWLNGISFRNMKIKK